MKPETEAKFYESYRVGFKKGYKEGLADAISVFKSLQIEYGFKIDDKEFYLMLEDLRDAL